MKRSVTEGQSERISSGRQNLALHIQYSPDLMPGAQDALSHCAVPDDFLIVSPVAPLSSSILSLEERNMKSTGAGKSLETHADYAEFQQEVQNRTRIAFKVPMSELHSTNKNALSPLFELPWNPLVKVKMILSPPVCCQTRGGASFRKCKGKDLKLEIKCEEGQEAAGRMKFNLYIGVQYGLDSTGREDKRGPFAHDFNYNSVAGLPKDMPGWSFDLKSLAKDGHLVCGAELYFQ